MPIRSSRNSLLKGTFLFLLWVFSFCNPLVANPTFHNYEKLLAIAEEKITTQNPGRAFSFLQKARELEPDPDFRYFNLLGDAHWKLQQTYLAIEAYEKSLEKNQNQFPLFLRIADFYEKERKPDKALIFSEKYLDLVPNDKNRIFRAAILSRRMGKENAFQSYIKTLESDTTFATEKDSLRTTLVKYVQLKKWKEAENLTLKYLPYFPREEFMYETLILARRGQMLTSVEEAYTLACVIFKEETRYFVRYGVYLQENQRYIEALSSLRRAFSNGIRYKKEDDWGEILFLIRQTYSNLGRSKDSLAIDSLVKDTKLKESLKGEILENHIATYRKNREYLFYGIYFFKDKNPELVQIYTKEMQERDSENEYKELLFVIGPFSLETKEY